MVPPISTGMVLFAGPIVFEWYWIPIFIVVMFVLPALTVAVISEVYPSGPAGRDRSRAAKRGRMWGIVAVAMVSAVRSSSTWRSPKLQEGPRGWRYRPRVRLHAATSRDRSRFFSPSRGVSGLRPPLRPRAGTATT